MSIFNNTYGTTTKTNILGELKSQLSGKFSVIERESNREFLDAELEFNWSNTGSVVIVYSTVDKNLINVNIYSKDNPSEEDFSNLKNSCMVICNFVESIS